MRYIARILFLLVPALCAGALAFQMTEPATAAPAPPLACMPGQIVPDAARIVRYAPENSIPRSYMVVFRLGIQRGEPPDYVTAAQKAAAGVTIEGRQMQISHDYSFGFAVRLPRQWTAQQEQNAIGQLSRLCGVEFVEADQRASLDVVPIGLDRLDKRTLPLDNTYAPKGDGKGVHVYVIDSGIDINHLELRGRTTEHSAVSTDPNDIIACNGHGTAVAGVIGGGNTFGVATQVSLHSVRVTFVDPETGECIIGESAVADGIDWVRFNATKPAVANISVHLAPPLGAPPPTTPCQSSPGPFPPCSSTVDRAVELLINSGVTVVASAGNNHKDACAYSPARVADAITVGAVETHSKGAQVPSDADVEAAFTNFGPCVDLFAPGVGIDTAMATGLLSVCPATHSPNMDNKYNGAIRCNGTSMSAAHVSGCAALYLATDRMASPEDVWKKGLFDKANHKDTPGKPDTPGWGDSSSKQQGIISPEPTNPARPPAHIKDRHSDTPNILLYCGN